MKLKEFCLRLCMIRFNQYFPIVNEWIIARLAPLESQKPIHFELTSMDKLMTKIK